MTCCNKKRGLCPISFGLALGITAALAMFIFSVWIMHYGYPMMPGHPMPQGEALPVITWGEVAMGSLWALLKGFLFGLVLALFYDLFICCCRARCCRSDHDCKCQCGPNDKKVIG